MRALLGLFQAEDPSQIDVLQAFAFRRGSYSTT